MGLLDDIAGFFGLGGDGGGGGTSYSVVSTVQGGDTPVGLVSTVQGGEMPISVDAGLDDVNIDVGGTGIPLHSVGELRLPEPIETASDLRLAVTEPIVSRVDSRVDVQPVQLDLCLNVGLTRLPRARVRQPYHSHFGITVLGMEVAGYRWSGDANTIIDELDDRPHHELDAEYPPGHGDPTAPGRHDEHRAVRPRPGRGVHVRLQ